MSRKLYVGNMPYEMGEAELQELFARAGSVESVSVMNGDTYSDFVAEARNVCDRASGRSQ